MTTDIEKEIELELDFLPLTPSRGNAREFAENIPQREKNHVGATLGRPIPTSARQERGDLQFAVIYRERMDTIAMVDYALIRLVDEPRLKRRLAEWFSGKWGIPVQAYLDSMEECLSGRDVPQWYAAICGGEIIGGLGVIENDFHERKDLAPNVCAVYVEEPFRGQGIAGKLLSLVCEDMKRRGIGTLYLLTDHDSFYERYGWRFYCMAKNDGEETLSRIYIHETE